MTIRSHRLRLGLTQEELARRAGLSVRALRDIEQGRVTRPRDGSYDRLLAALDLKDDSHRQPKDLSDLSIGILGPLVVSARGVTVNLVSGPQQTLLGALALHATDVVSIDELAEVFWPDRVPPAWRNLIHVYVNRLRAVLEPTRKKRAPAQVIASVGSGYRLDIPTDALDLTRFDRLAEAAKQQHDPAQAMRLYGEALASWRGPVLAGADDSLRRRPAALAAARRRLTATLAFAELALPTGGHAEVEPRLRALAADEPLHEGLHAALMTTLACGGDQAGALQLFADFRTRLADELGVDPGAEIQASHQRVLDGATLSEPPTETDTPNQLPPAGRDFVGREHAIAQLDGWLTEVSGDALLAITGGAGVGKTSLAVLWGQRAASAYPDGQLYVNLNGQGDERAPLSVLDALSFLLRSIGVAAERVPTTLDDALTTYRSMTANRRMLVLLDNAYGSEQVRPLLPGGSDSLVIVTSRDRLSGLVAKDGARRLELDVLEPDEAVSLIGLLTGDDTVRAEPAAAADLARLCAYLPLAVRIAAASMADRRYRRLSQLVTDLSVDGWPDALDITDDPQARVRVAFDNSYNQVPPSAQRMFRLLGLMPGADVSIEAAQALAGQPLSATREQLRRLTGAHLLDESDGERFTFHDLLRRYAIDVGQQRADRADLGRARARLNRHYLDTAYAAARALNPEILRLPYPEESLPTFEDESAALAWLDAERPNLLAAIQRATDDGYPDLAWQLSDVLRGYFTVRRFMSDWLGVAQLGIAAARARQNRLGEFGALISFSRAKWMLGQRAEAAETGLAAVAMAREIGWYSGLAMSLTNVGAIYGEWGKLKLASDHLKAAYQVVQNHDTPGFVPGHLLGNLGVACHDLGQFDEAIEYHQRSLDVFEPLGAELSIATTKGNLGACYLGKGDFVRSAEFCMKALDMHQRFGDQFGIATIAVDLARIHLSLGRIDEATRLARLALAAALEVRAENRIAPPLSVLGTIERSPERHEHALRKANGMIYSETEARTAYACTLMELGRHREALELADQALDAARRAEYHLLQGGAATARAEALLSLGRPDEAKSQAEQALAIHWTCNSVRYVGRTISVIEIASHASR